MIKGSNPARGQGVTVPATDVSISACARIYGADLESTDSDSQRGSARQRLNAAVRSNTGRDRLRPGVFFTDARITCSGIFSELIYPAAPATRRPVW